MTQQRKKDVTPATCRRPPAKRLRPHCRGLAALPASLAPPKSNSVSKHEPLHVECNFLHQVMCLPIQRGTAVQAAEQVDGAEGPPKEA